MNKIIQWALLNGASILGIIQAILKCGKEIATAVVNLLAILMPSSKIITVVGKVRDVANKMDEFVEKYKGKLIK